MPEVKEVTASQPKSSAVGGAVFRAPIGTTVPTDAVTALDAAFTSLGFISADGIVKNVSMESETIRDWGGEAVYTTNSGRTASIKGKFISSLNTEVQKMVYGDNNVSGDLTNGIQVQVNSDELEPYVYVIDAIERDGVIHRIVLPNAVPTEIGEITYVKNDLVGFDVTLTGMQDASGQSMYEYYKKA